MTESEPLFKFKPNRDKLRGPHCRTDLKSGIIIDKYPFNFRFLKKKELLRIKRDDRYIVTTLYQKATKKLLVQTYIFRAFYL